MGLLVLEKSALDLPGTVVVNASGHRAVQVSGAQRAHSLPVTLVLKIGTHKVSYIIKETLLVVLIYS